MILLSTVKAMRKESQPRKDQRKRMIMVQDPLSAMYALTRLRILSFRCVAIFFVGLAYISGWKRGQSDKFAQRAKLASAETK